MSFFSRFLDKLGFFPRDVDFGPSLASINQTGLDGGSEVVQEQDGLLYVTNGDQDQIDVIDAATGDAIDAIDLSGLPGYSGVQSVAVSGDLVAVAVSTTFEFQQSDAVDGWVVFYDVNDLTAPPNAVPVGNLPDMVTFSQDGKFAFSANEGEPGEPGELNEGTNPAGSISVIDLSDFSVTTVGFEGVEIPEGVRIFPGINPLVDLEPEYIAEAGGKLFVTLQEAAAVGVFDIETKSWDKIIPLGSQDHSQVPLDANDDGLIEIRTYDNLVGMRMADAIAATEIDGKTYFLTANEGDDRGDWDDVELGTIGDAARIGDIRDGGVQYTNPETGEVVDVKFTADLETYLASLPGDGLDRLKISIFDGVNEAGEIETMHTYGSRSFTIFDSEGEIVFDSGAQFEQLLSVFSPDDFNNDDGEVISPDGEVDNRSDAKGPEPEAIEIGKIGDTTLAFIGLERTGEVMIYDISDPENARFLDFIDGRAGGNVSPEIIDFIAPEDSATGEAQIAVSYEVSGSTAVYDLPFGETVKGGFRDDVLVGSIGKDKIFGRAGDDEIDAGGNDDIVHGGFGNDVIDGGFGDDVLTGGHGADVFQFNFFSGDDVIKDFRRDDMIDLSQTGLSFEDLTITKTGRKEFLVEYGDFGDSIEVNLKGLGNNALTVDDFMFS